MIACLKLKIGIISIQNEISQKNITINFPNFDQISIFYLTKLLFVIQSTHTLLYPSFFGESTFILWKKSLYEHGNSFFISNIVITLFG